jgi:hypothetical protein
MPASRRVLRRREALGSAGLLGLTALPMGAGQAALGAGGWLAATALAAVADVHAALAALASALTISARDMAQGALLTKDINALSRSAVAAIVGGAAYALRVGAALAAGVAAAGTTAIAMGLVSP